MAGFKHNEEGGQFNNAVFNDPDVGAVGPPPEPGVGCTYNQTVYNASVYNCEGAEVIPPGPEPEEYVLVPVCRTLRVESESRVVVVSDGPWGWRGR